MEQKIIAFPAAVEAKASQDPAYERALFFAEYELIELVASIPQTELDTESKLVY